MILKSLDTRWKGCSYVEKSFIIKSPAGLHARPAALLVQKANSFPCDISLVKGEKKVNAKSIMSILALGIEANEGCRQHFRQNPR